MANGDQEIVKRLRAARAYADLGQKALGEAVETSGETIKRMESGERTPKASELWAIAEACGLPREFFTINFQNLPLHLELDRQGISFSEALDAAVRSNQKGKANMETASHLSKAAQSLEQAAEALRLNTKSGSEPSPEEAEEEAIRQARGESDEGRKAG